MVLIVVKENQTVRGVKMSHEQFIINHIKVIILILGLFLIGNSAFGKTETSIVGGVVGKLGSDYSTMQVDVYVNGLYHPFQAGLIYRIYKDIFITIYMITFSAIRICIKDNSIFSYFFH